MNKYFEKMWLAVLCLCVLCSSSCFIACNSSGADGKDAEKFAEQFYTYYIKNYDNVDGMCEEIANKYLTEEFGKSYVYEMKRTYPVDLICTGLMYNKELGFGGTFNKAEYIGENKVVVYFDKPEGGQFDWLLTLTKVGSEYRIANVEINN